MTLFGVYLQIYSCIQLNYCFTCKLEKLRYFSFVSLCGKIIMVNVFGEIMFRCIFKLRFDYFIRDIES